MNIRDLEISLRPRKGSEAVDLGFILTKSYYRDLLKIGTKAFVPFWIILFLLTWKEPWLGITLIWIFKPIYDRFYLHYFSRRIFGEQVSVKDVLKQWKTFVFKKTFTLLTFQRLNAYRSMTMPVTELEQLKGKAYSKRTKVVKRIGGQTALLTTIILSYCESIVLFSIVGLLVSLIPQEFVGPIDENFLINIREYLDMDLYYRLSMVLYSAIVLFLEPFYVGAGFCLYLNSRSSQEAWDIELQFKEFASRVQNTLLKPLSLLLLSGSFFLASTAPTAAQTSPQTIQEAVEKVYEHEDFVIHTKTEKHFEKGDLLEAFINRVQEFSNSSKEWFSQILRSLNLDFLADFFSNIGKAQNASAGSMDGIIKLFGITILAALVITILVITSRQFKGRQAFFTNPRKHRLRKKPSIIMGMEITKESLPSDLISAARKAWNNDDRHKALSLLYRGSLSHAVMDYDTPVEDSYTEYECLSTAQKTLPDGLATYFSRVTKSWMTTAYSQYDVSSQEFSTLCDQWPFLEN